ncbi:MAG: hypothetical protein EB051_00170 [Chlamydiia bacterium]|jgi:hypothetical protein|nr:hypothetical protein [Chlamydiia bacterium]
MPGPVNLSNTTQAASVYHSKDKQIDLSDKESKALAEKVLRITQGIETPKGQQAQDLSASFIKIQAEYDTIDDRAELGITRDRGFEVLLSDSKGKQAVILKDKQEKGEYTLGIDARGEGTVSEKKGCSIS